MRKASMIHQLLWACSTHFPFITSNFGHTTIDSGASALVPHHSGDSNDSCSHYTPIPVAGFRCSS
ncbi:hypothetical protein KP509_04G108300 [Ceratopteris richardii]|uniref:Uncharacterized protein n=1 Tax=Ceratopteris richardii TaxID=49495 RepID=A0A8T2V2R7_CERRI|nr:hypothetical protein KP509_04G108300 [Ceratopteris richardii]